MKYMVIPSEYYFSFKLKQNGYTFAIFNVESLTLSIEKSASIFYCDRLIYIFETLKAMGYEDIQDIEIIKKII